MHRIYFWVHHINLLQLVENNMIVFIFEAAILSQGLSHLVCTIQMILLPHSHHWESDPCISEPPSLQRWDLGTSYRTTGGLVDCSTCSHFPHTGVCHIERPKSEALLSSSLVLGSPTRNCNQKPQTEVGSFPLRAWTDIHTVICFDKASGISVHVMSASRRTIGNCDSIHVVRFDACCYCIIYFKESIGRTYLITTEPSAHRLVAGSRSGYFQWVARSIAFLSTRWSRWCNLLPRVGTLLWWIGHIQIADHFPLPAWCDSEKWRRRTDGRHIQKAHREAAEENHGKCHHSES